MTELEFYKASYIAIIKRDIENMLHNISMDGGKYYEYFISWKSNIPDYIRKEVISALQDHILMIGYTLKVKAEKGKYVRLMIYCPIDESEVSKWIY